MDNASVKFTFKDISLSLDIDPHEIMETRIQEKLLRIFRTFRSYVNDRITVRRTFQITLAGTRYTH